VRLLCVVYVCIYMMKIHRPVLSGIVRWLTDADPFKVLGVSRGATDAQVKEAFQNLARKHHPDANPDKKEESTKKFQEINNAYQTLTNTEKRQKFEAEEAMKRGGFGGGGGGGPFGGRSQEDVFSSFFDGRSGRYGGGFGPNGPQAANIPLRGADVQTRVRISFMESMHGTTKELLVPGHCECLTCRGSGLKPGTSRKTCPLCKGMPTIPTIPTIPTTHSCIHAFVSCSNSGVACVVLFMA
jgi:molecular chaperone DnaJ